MTLVEAVLGTAILGSLLVASLLATSKMQSQTSRSQQRILACQIADDLLNQWWEKPGEIPRDDSGPIEGHAEWKWETRTLDRPLDENLQADVVALRIYHSESSSDEPAATVELMLPKQKNETDQSNDAG